MPLIPTHETQAYEFLKIANGKDVIVAVLDTGVCLKAAGLSICPDGSPKIIDSIDASGSGDVVMSSKEVDVLDDGTIVGASGRKIKINQSWGAKKFRVGKIWAWTLYPKPLVSRLKDLRKEKYEEKQRKLEVEILECSLKAKKSLEADKGNSEKTKESVEMEARVEALKELSKTYSDNGPCFDCVSYFDGTNWRGAIDTLESGDLSQAASLTNFKLERQCATFCSDSLLNYCINFYDNGDIMSIVNDVGAHGTHVAGIIGANHPDAPELNGVAPGCKIVAIRIGDSRLGSMETSTGLERALKCVLDNGVDVINLSYGEPTSLPNRGRFIEMVNEIVNVHHVIFVASAGNDGPALTSAGAPGACTSSILGIGAYVSEPMMEEEYSMKSPTPLGNQYTWSSRGPNADGEMAVSVSAPGGAITSVPTWCLSKSQLMNGTSMSSPNAAGNVALLLSAAKAEKLSYSPHRIRRVIEYTAIGKNKVEAHAIGSGLIQIKNAYDYFKETISDSSMDLRIEVITTFGTFKGKGIYIRDSDDLKTKKVEVNVSVKPVWDSLEPSEKNEEKTKFEKIVTLSTDDDSSWLKIPKTVVMMNNERAFDVEIDPSKLSTGINFSYIYFKDSASNVLFLKIPVTVITPTLEGNLTSVAIPKLPYSSGTMHRHFISVPHGTSWVDVTLNSFGDDSYKTYSIHLMQVIAGVSKINTSRKQMIKMNGNSSSCISMSTEPGKLLEICVAQYWNQTSESEVSVEIDFHGLIPDNNQLTVLGSEGYESIRVSALFQSETVKPDFSLTKWRSTLLPKCNSIKPLGERDLFPKNRQTHQLELKYEFKSTEKGETIRPICPIFENLLYESNFGSCAMLIYTSDGKYVGMSDAEPSDIKLFAKGDYYILFYIKHENISLLEALTETPIFIERKLTKISLKVYDTLPELSSGGSEFRSRKLRLGESVNAFISFSGLKDKIPKSASVGDSLFGSYTLTSRAGSLRGSNTESSFPYPLSYIIPTFVSDSKKKEDESKDDRDAKTKMEEALASTRIKELKKLLGKTEFDSLYEEALNLSSKVSTEILLDFHECLLKHLDSETDRLNRLQKIITCCDEGISKIDITSLAAYNGLRAISNDDDNKEIAKEKKLNEKKKSFLIECLHTKVRAFLDILKAASIDTEKEEAKKNIKTSMTQLEQWADISGSKYILTAIEHDIIQGYYGKALKSCLKVMSEKVSTDLSKPKVFDLAITIVKKLEWLDWVSQLENSKRAEFNY